MKRRGDRKQKNRGLRNKGAKDRVSFNGPTRDNPKGTDHTRPEKRAC